MGSPDTWSTPSTSRRIAAIRLDSNRLRILGGTAVATTALGILAVPAASAPFRADVDGDGIVDSATVHGSTLTVLTASALVSVRVRSARGTQVRLDGSMRVHGIPGVLLLVRVRRGATGITDAPYRLHGGRLERLRVGPSAPNGLVTAAGAGGFADFDCGSAPRTIVQISAEPRGSVWKETVLTFELQAAGFVLAKVDRRTVGFAAAARRRCPLVRTP